MKSNSNNTSENVFLQMASLNLDGNIIPHSWYEAITFDNGKPHLPAIIILSDIVYWYKPEPVKDETTGKFLGYRKKIKEDLLQRSYKSFENQFGFSKKQIKTALVKLEELGLIRRIFRNVELDNGSRLANVMYIQIFPKKIKELTYGHPSKIVSSSANSTESEEEHTYGHRGTEVRPSENPEKSGQGHRYGHTGTQVCTSMSRGYGHRGTEGMDIEGQTNTENTITETSITENNNSLNTTAPNEKSFAADENGATERSKSVSENINGENNAEKEINDHQSSLVNSDCQTIQSAKLVEKSNKFDSRVKKEINFNFETEEWENISEKDIENWKKAYPACDIEVELERMKQWLLANPNKRKKNYRRFIVNWLSRQQDRGGTIRNSGEKCSSVEDILKALEEVE